MLLKPTETKHGNENKILLCFKHRIVFVHINENPTNENEPDVTCECDAAARDRQIRKQRVISHRFFSLCSRCWFLVSFAICRSGTLQQENVVMFDNLILARLPAATIL